MPIWLNDWRILFKNHEGEVLSLRFKLYFSCGAFAVDY